MSPPNAEQRTHWNDLSGPRWVALQPRMDRQLAVFTDVLLARLELRAGERVLDVGCGCGGTTLELARAVGPDGRVTGVDLSGPMLHRARERAAAEGLVNVQLVLCDAQVDPLPGAPFDALASRFGVMFFDDPTAAFAHMGEALAPGARVALVCWQSPELNPWITVPRDAARAVLGEVKLAPPGAPGPFAFADPARVREALTSAGYTDVSVDALNTPMPLGGGGDLDDATSFLLQIGPTAQALREATDAQVAEVRVAVREALAPFTRDDGVWLDSAAWVVTARR